MMKTKRLAVAAGQALLDGDEALLVLLLLALLLLDHLAELGKLCALLRRARLLEQLGEPLSLAPLDGVHELRNVCDGAVVRPLE